MDKLRRLLVSLSLVAVFLFGPAMGGTYRARAQGMFTMDIQNILQNILQYLTSLDALDFDEEQVAALQEKIGNFTNAIKNVMDAANGLSAAMDIARVGLEIADETQRMLDYSEYFVRNGYSAEVIIASRVLIKEYGALLDDLKKDYDKIQMTMDNGEKSVGNTGVDLSFFITLQEYMYQYRAKVRAISWHYRSEMSRLYRKEMMYRQALANRNFRRTRIY